MSFILDALRKSDAERQRAATPGLADVRYTAARPRRNIWVPILIVVLLANVVFMGVQWLRKPAPPAATAAIEGLPAGAPAPDVRPLARESGLPAEGMGEPAADGEQMEMPANTQGDAPVQAPVVSEMAERAVPAMTAPPPAAEPAAQPMAAPKQSRISESNDLPTAERLIAGGTLKVPELNLDLHVYSATPAGRFVVINTRKYKEGAHLSEGPTLESITPDGVILDNQGTRFFLPRK